MRILAPGEPTSRCWPPQPAVWRVDPRRRCRLAAQCRRGNNQPRVSIAVLGPTARSRGAPLHAEIRVVRDNGRKRSEAVRRPVDGVLDTAGFIEPHLTLTRPRRLCRRGCRWYETGVPPVHGVFPQWPAVDYQDPFGRPRPDWAISPLSRGFRHRARTGKMDLRRVRMRSAQRALSSKMELGDAPGSRRPGTLPWLRPRRVHDLSGVAGPAGATLPCRCPNRIAELPGDVIAPPTRQLLVECAFSAAGASAQRGRAHPRCPVPRIRAPRENTVTFTLPAAHSGIHPSLNGAGSMSQQDYDGGYRALRLSPTRYAISG